jgi:hypothetical protein
MLGHGVDLSGLGHRPVKNTAYRSACSSFPNSLFVSELSLVGATRLAAGNDWIAGLDTGSRKLKRQSQNWQQNVFFVYIYIRHSQNDRSLEKNKDLFFLRF